MDHSSSNYNQSRKRSRGNDASRIQLRPPLPHPIDNDKSMSTTNDTDAARLPDDPFYFALKCKPSDQPRLLWWHSPDKHLALATEESMIDVLVKWKKSERGMMKSQPAFRLDQVRKLCRVKGVPIRQALSLRRHHMKRFNPGLRMGQMQLGKEDDVRESARLFEEAVQQFLVSQDVAFWSEGHHKKHIRKHRKEGDPFPPTPDFILQEQVRVQRYTYAPHRKGNNNNNNKGHDDKRTVVEQRSICWVEAKMFYGASTIEHDNKSAVGCLLATARKYVRVYGQGAMVFMHGCGDRLAAELAHAGVIALDCTSDKTVLLDVVERHQRTWCADRNGNILP